jgi:hypothetical protein
MTKAALLLAPGDIYQTILQGRYVPLGFSAQNVERLNGKLIDKGWTVTSLQNEEATRNRVMEFLQDNLSTVDRMLFYFSGHGDVSSYPGIDEPDGDGDSYLVLYDRSLEFRRSSTAAEQFALMDNDLTTIVRQYLVDNKEFTAVLDCCHGAGMLDTVDDFLDEDYAFRLFSSSTSNALSFADGDTSFFTEALLMASAESRVLMELKKNTERNLHDLYPDQRCVIRFNQTQNNKPIFL